MISIMKDIRFTLTINEANLVLKALGNLPYQEVFKLVEKIQAQANLQINHLNGDDQHKQEQVTESSIQQH